MTTAAGTGTTRRAPAKKAAASKTAAPPVGSSTTSMHRRGKGRFSDWADTVADITITNVDELYEFCENSRAFFQEAGALIEVTAKQFEHDLKLTEKKKDSRWSWLNISFGGRFRKTTTEMYKIGDALEAAAKHAFACWNAYEKASLEMQEEIRAAEIAARHGNKGSGGFDHEF